MNTLKLSMCSGRNGFVLLDALIAIVIFAIGILGMVKLQSNAVSYASDAQYRTEAAMLADQVIAAMWIADQQALVANFKGDSDSGGAGYKAWNALVGHLPGGEGTIAIDTSGVAEITVSWTPPGTDTPHQYVSRTQIAR